MLSETDCYEIVVSDDADELRARLTFLLNSHPHFKVVGEADNADDAVELTTTLHPDVVILDIQMPGNGIKALRRIKSDQSSSLVVMFTNHSDAFYERICLKEGADAFLDKSNQFNQVPDILMKLLTA